MNIGVHWKICDKSGSAIDRIENELRDITGRGVYRTEFANAKHNFDATYAVVGDIRADDLAEACQFMDEQGAFPV